MGSIGGVSAEEIIGGGKEVEGMTQEGKEMSGVGGGGKGMGAEVIDRVISGNV